MWGPLAFCVSLFAADVLATPNLVVERATCNRDDCLRAVVASSVRPGTASASRDCSAVLIATVTPCAVTVTTSSTTTFTLGTVTVSQSTVQTVTSSNSYIKRAATIADRQDICPTTRSVAAVPTYASACVGISRYSSACSCNGIVGSTVTLSPATVTTQAIVTVTVPATTTTTSVSTTVVPQACNTFIVQATSGTYAGNYVNLEEYSFGPGSGYLTPSAHVANAVHFVLAFNGTFTSIARPDLVAFIFGPNGSDVSFVAVRPSDPSTMSAANSYIVPQCTIGAGYDATTNAPGTFTCSASENGRVYNQFAVSPATYGDRLLLTSYEDISKVDNSYESIGLVAYPAC